MVERKRSCSTRKILVAKVIQTLVKYKMNKEYNLPYDYARCFGEFGHETCSDCMRKLSPGRAVWQSFISVAPEENGQCKYKISVEQWTGEKHESK